MKRMLSLVMAFAMISALCVTQTDVSAQTTDWEDFLAKNTHGQTILEETSFENGEWKLLSDDRYDLSTISGDKTYLELVAHYYDTAPTKTEGGWTGLNGTCYGENSVTVGSTVQWQRKIPSSSDRKKASYYIADDAFRSGSDKTLTKLHLTKALDKTYNEGKIAVLFHAKLENGNSGLHIKSISDADFLNRYEKNGYTKVAEDGNSHEFVCLTDLEHSVCDIYVDGTKKASISGGDVKNEISYISFAATGRTGGNQNNSTLESVKVIYFPDLGKKIAEKLSFSMISNNQPQACVKEDLNLISTFEADGKTVNVSWNSSDECINAESGVVTRGTQGKAVTLTATLSAADINTEKSFDVFVPAYGDVLLVEDFESIEEGKSLATSTTVGENGWLLQSDNYEKAIKEGDRLVVETDAQNSTKTLNVVRTVSGTDNSVNMHFNVQKYFETVKGLIAYRFKIYGDNTGMKLRVPLTSNLENSQIKFNDEKSTVLPFKNSSGKTVTIYDKQWHEVYYTFDYNTLEVDFYIDGESVGKTTLSSRPDNNIVLFGMQRATKGTVKIDDVLITRPDYNTRLDIKKALNTIKTDLQSKSFEEAVTLSSIGILNTAVSYEVVSGNISVADSQLKFERLLGTDQTAVVGVTVSRNGLSESEHISLTIPAYTQAEYDVKDFNFTTFAPNERQDLVENNISLPITYNGYTLKWSSSNEKTFNSQTGNINRGLYDVPLTLTVSFQKDGTEEANKQFDIVVAAAGSVIGNESFDVTVEVGTNIADCTQWKIDGVELATADVHYKTAKNMYDAEDGVLKVERYYLRSSGQSPSAQIAYRTIAKKCERLALTFDIMFEDEVSTASFKLFNTDGNTINELFEMTTKYIMQKSFKNTKTTFKTPFELQKWYRVQLVFDAYKDTYDIFVDYEKINDAPFVVEGLGGTPNAVGFYSDSFSTVYDTFYINNVLVRDLSTDTATSLELAKNALEITYSADMSRITLPKTGEQNTAISWTSSNPAAVATDGTVAGMLGREQEVTLTATITKNGENVTKEFPLTIPALDAYAVPNEELMRKIADEITFSLISDEHRLLISENLNLVSEYNRATAATIGGVNIAWNCPLSNVIDAKGEVKRQKYDVRTVLTATITSKTNPEVKFEKQFPVTVAARGKTVRQYDFEDTASSEFGEAMASRRDFSNKVVVPGRDYGMQFFVDRLFDTRKDETNPSENALYLRRYINHADVRSDCYLKMDKESGAGSMYDDPSQYETCDLSIVSFKFLLECASDIRFQFTDISTSQIRIELTRLVYPDLTVTFDEPLSTDSWHEFELVTDNLLRTSDFYLDGKKLNDLPVSMTSTTGYVNEARFYNKNGQGNILVDDLTVRYLSTACDEYVKADKETLNIPSTITGHVELPLVGENNSRVKWVSSDKTILSENGNALSDGSVTLTAYIMQGNCVDTKTFTVNVKTDQQKVTINSARLGNSELNLSSEGELVDGVYCVKLYRKGSVTKILTAPYRETASITIPTNCKYDSLTVHVRDKDKNSVSSIVKIER